MIDVLLQQTDNDGDVTYRNGTLEYDATLRTAVYLSLFGGNKDDNGAQNSKNQFWGNFLKSEAARGYRSLTQYLLNESPLTSALLPRIEDAVKQDLKWVLTEGLASDIAVTASIAAINTLAVTININGLVLKFVYKYGNTNSQ